MTERGSLADPEILSAIQVAELELEGARSRMATAVARVRSDLATLTDVRRPIRSRPFAFVGGAFLLGFLWALTRKELK